jgi:hypothetical protein
VDYRRSKNREFFSGAFNDAMTMDPFSYFLERQMRQLALAVQGNMGLRGAAKAKP